MARAGTLPWCSGLPLPGAQPCFWDEGIVGIVFRGCPTCLRCPEFLSTSLHQSVSAELHGGGTMERIFGNHRDIWKSKQPQGHGSSPATAPGWVCLWQQAVTCPRALCGVPNWGRDQVMNDSWLGWLWEGHSVRHGSAKFRPQKPHDGCCLCQGYLAKAQGHLGQGGGCCVRTPVHGLG